MKRSDWTSWIGKQEQLFDVCGPVPAQAMAASLDRPRIFEKGTPLPHPWVWLYFLPLAPMSRVGDDGHPKRGGFLPSIVHPRRMWAGSRMTFFGTPKIGDRLEKISTIKSIIEKDGAAGPMVFVTVSHDIKAQGVTCIQEDQDIVYMTIAPTFTPPKAKPLPTDCSWSQAIPLDPVLLFRFSALTFNGHRIHYDRPYAVDVEKYPGLVVHGPLQAIMLYDVACRQNAGETPASFSFRGIHPAFEHDTLTLNGKTVEEGLELMTANGDGTICMQAKMTWAEGHDL